VNPVTGAVTGQTIIPGDGQSEQLAVGDLVAVSGETGPIMIVDPVTMKIVSTMSVPAQHPASMTSLYGQIYAITDDEIVRLATTEDTEPVVFHPQATSFGGVNQAPTISAATGLLWASANSRMLGIEPDQGEVASVGQVADASHVASTGSSGSVDVPLLAAVSNGIVRLAVHPD
jgi:hypothetical protein